MNGPVLAWQFSHQWFVDSQIVWIATTSQPVGSGVMEREKKKGVRRVRWRCKLNCFLRKRPWYLYIPRLLTSHWPELSGIATPSSHSLVSSCAAMCKALKRWFWRLWWGEARSGKKEAVGCFALQASHEEHVDHVPGLLALHTVLFCKGYREPRAWKQSMDEEKEGESYLFLFPPSPISHWPRFTLMGTEFCSHLL